MTARALAERPPLSAPGRVVPDARRHAELGQPALGLAGLALVVPVAVLLGAGLGDLERSLLVLAPIATFGLPVIATIAFWWEDWPGTLVRAPMLGLSDTLLVAVGGVAATIAGQAVVAHPDLRGVLDPAAPLVDAPTFPATLALGGAIFTVMLQLTLVAEGFPLRRLPRLPAGLAALGVSWAAGVGLYEALVPTGLVEPAVLGSVLVCVGAVQVAVYVVLRGWPFAAIASRARRLAAANLAVVAAGCAAYVLVADAAGLGPVRVTAAAGAVVAAGLVVGMLFDGWLEPRLGPSAGRAANVAMTCALAAALLLALQALAGAATWTRAEPAEWTAHATLNAIGAGVILHVAIGRRWPFRTA
jgi:hypothetical protein